MFNINGETWKIVLVSPHNPHLRRSDGSFALGVCDDSTKTIYLNETMSADMTKKVLTHEITHASMFSYDVDLCPRQEELVAILIDTYGQEIIALTNQLFKLL